MNTKQRTTQRIALARKGIWNVLLIIPMLLVSGCDLFGDECNKCQDAIDHMYSKAPQNFCDRTNMANAVQRIKDDCQDADFDPDYIVQCLLENCAAGSFSPPLCPSPGTGIPLEIPIYRESDMPASSSFGDAELVVMVLPQAGGQTSHSFFLGQMDEARLNEGSWDDGDEITFQLYDPMTDVALTPVVTKSLDVRSLSPPLNRRVNIQYVEASDEWTIDFTYW